MEEDRRVSFTAMKEGTVEDFELIRVNDEITARALPDRLLEHLKEMEKDDGAYQVNRLQHVLQCATRAFRAGADDDWIAAALLHDIGDVLAPYTHGQLASEVLRPFVRDEVAWVVRHHGTFQMYYNVRLPESQRNGRDQFRDHPFFQKAVDFCEQWDQCAFDPGYDTLDLKFFEPIIRRVFTRRPFSQ